MILHITFRDHSNPFVAYGNYKEIRAAWKKWENNPNAAPLIWGHVPGWYIRIDTGIPGRAPAYYLEDPDGDNVSVYAHGWSHDQIRGELADAIGAAPEEIELYEFTGWSRTAVYTEVKTA